MSSYSAHLLGEPTSFCSRSERQAQVASTHLKAVEATRLRLPCAGRCPCLLVGDRLPHQLGPLDYQLRRPVLLRADLSNPHAKGVIDPAVTFVLAKVGRARHYLPSTNRVGSAVAAIVEEYLRPVDGLDDALKVGQECSIAAPVGVVCTNEASCDASLAAPFSQEEELAFGVIRARQVRAPPVRVSEPDTIERLQPHSASPCLDDLIDGVRIVLDSARQLPSSSPSRGADQPLLTEHSQFPRALRVEADVRAHSTATNKAPYR